MTTASKSSSNAKMEKTIDWWDKDGQEEYV